MKRYEIDSYDFREVEDKTGDWVKYAEAEPLLDRIEELKEEIRLTKNDMDDYAEQKKDAEASCRVWQEEYGKHEAENKKLREAAEVFLLPALNCPSFARCYNKDWSCMNKKLDNCRFIRLADAIKGTK